MEPYVQPPAANPMDPLNSNVGYIPQRGMDIESMMGKHLDTSDMILKLKNMLLGLELDDESDEWIKVMNTIGYDKEGKEVKVLAGPLMPERTIRSIISSLEMYLSSNTFLSELPDDARNDIMFGVCQNLAIIWLRLGNRIRPEERAVIHSTIKDAIFLGLSRANRKITLDAMSKSQQTHEIIQASPKPQQQAEKEFKVLGW